MRIPAQNRKGLLRRHRGQNITEYLLVFSAVVVFLVVALRPGGMVEDRLTGSLNRAFESFNQTLNQQCLTLADKIDGGWSNWTAWSGCLACSRFRTRECKNPEPQCGGAECTRQNGTQTTLVPIYNRGEMETEWCVIAADQWDLNCPCDGIPGACEFCSGVCKATTGTQDCGVSCLDMDSDGGYCCDPADKYSNIQPCEKAAYPGTWTAFYGACQVSCGSGVKIATLVCDDPDSCCDPDDPAKPAATEACTAGCCAATLEIGLGFTAQWPKSGDGSVTLTGVCPAGYAGTPTRTCLNGEWQDDLTNGCVPADCSSTQGDATQNVCDTSEAPGCSLITAFPDTAHTQDGTIDCDAVDPVTLLPLYTQTNGASYTGTATMQCMYGDWVEATLVPGCIPNCPQDKDVAIGAGLTQTFPETQNPGGLGVPVSYDCTKSPYTEGGACGQKRYVGFVSRTCDAGTWSALSGICDYKSCGEETLCDSYGVCVKFPSAAHNQSQTLSCDVGNPDDNLDGDVRYTGNFQSTCSYGMWTCNSTSNCSTKNCPVWDTTNNGVNVRFAATAHDALEVTAACIDTAAVCSTNTCAAAQAKCCFGEWFPAGTGCGSVSKNDIDGVNTSSGSCRPYACIHPTSVDQWAAFSVSNATRCSGTGTDPIDETILPGDTKWSLLDNTRAGWECTSAKCEYNCNDGYVQAGWDCVAAACSGGFSGAAQCPGDDPPNVNTNATLVADLASCSSPVEAVQCEWYCPSGDVIYNNACCTPKTCGELGYCGKDSGTGTLRYPDDQCGGTPTCRECCGDGTIGSGEVCDPNGPQLNGKYCTDFTDNTQWVCTKKKCLLWFFGTCIIWGDCIEGFYKNFDGGPLMCYSSTDANPCTFNTSNCCYAVNGTWGGDWVNVGGCGADCQQLQQKQECVGESCGGTCTLPYDEQYVGCFGGSSCCQSDGTCDDNDSCADTCNVLTWTCTFAACSVDINFQVATDPGSNLTNNQSAATSALLCAPFSNVSSISVSGGAACGASGTPGASCTATLSD